jgi:hypothetical protein
VSNAAPASASDGIRVRASFKAWTFYFTQDAARTVDLYVRSAGGVWTLAETFTLDDGLVYSRLVLNPGGRIGFRASAAAVVTLAVDVAVEV